MFVCGAWGSICEWIFNIAEASGTSWEGLTKKPEPEKIMDVKSAAYLENVFPFLLEGCSSKLCFLQKVNYIRTTILDLADKIIKPLSFKTNNGRVITLNASTKIKSLHTEFRNDDDATQLPAFRSMENLYAFLKEVDPTPFMKDLPLDLPEQK